MRLRVSLLLGLMAVLMTSLSAQTRRMEFLDASLADVLTAIDEQYPETKIHFVYNQLEAIRIRATFSANNAEEAVRSAIGHRPISVTAYRNHLFVEYLASSALSEPEEEDRQLFIKLRPLPNVDYDYQLPASPVHRPLTMLTVSGTPLANVGTAFDLLSFLPGVMVDDPSVIIYIDDMPVSMLSDLAAWDSRDIRSIDYSTSDSRVAYSGKNRVISIHTLRPETLGFQGLLHSRLSIGHGVSFRQSATADVHQPKWDLMTRADYERHSVYQSLLLNKKPLLKRYPTHTINLSAGMNFRLTPLHVMGFRYQYSDMLNTIEQHTEEALMGSFDPDNVQGLDIARSSWLLDYAPHHDLNVFYRGQTGRWHLRAGGNFYHDGFILMDDYRLVVQPIPQRNEVTNTLWAMKAEAERTIGRGRLLLGAEYSFTRREDQYQQIENHQVSSRLREQDRWSSIASYALQLKGFSAEAGLRLEYVDAVLRLKQHLFPFASVGYTGQRWQATGSYAMHSAMPTYGQTNGFAHYNLEMLTVSGNPDLRPSIRHQWSLQAQYGSLSFVGNVQYIRDYIAQRVGVYTAGYFLNYDNVRQAVMSEATLLYAGVVGRWQTQASATLLAQHLEKAYTDRVRNFNDPLLHVAWHNQWQLLYGFHALADLRISSSGHRGTIWQKHQGQLDLGLLKTLDRWSLQIKAEDVFKTGRSLTLSYGNGVIYSRRSYADTQRLLFSARYHFGAQQPRRQYEGVNAGNSEKERMLY